MSDKESIQWDADHDTDEFECPECLSNDITMKPGVYVTSWLCNVCNAQGEFDE